MNKKMFFLFTIIVSFTFQQCKIKNVIYIDENNICIIQKEDDIYFSTITDNWIYKDSLIVSLMSGEKKINIQLFNANNNKIFQRNIDISNFHIRKNNLLHQNKNLVPSFTYCPRDEKIYLFINDKVKPGIYEYSFIHDDSLSLFINYNDLITSISSSENYLVFQTITDTFGILNKQSHEIIKQENRSLTNFCIIDHDEVLLSFEDKTEILNLKSSEKKKYSDIVNIPIQNNNIYDNKFFYYSLIPDVKRNVFSDVHINFIDIKTSKITKNVINVKKDEKVDAIDLRYFSIDRNNELHLYTINYQKLENSNEEYREFYNHYIYDLSTYDLISSELNIEKLDKMILF